MIEKMTFFRSYFDAVRDLPADVYRESMNAILDYAFNGKVPDHLSPTANAIFCLTKPNIDKSLSRSEAGRNGGLSKHEANAKQTQAKPKQTASKIEANQKNVQAIKDIGVRSKDIGVEKENTKEKADVFDESEPPAEGIEISDFPFDTFWTMYAKYKKVGEREARLAFNNAAMRTDPEVIITGLKKIIDLQWSRWPKQKYQYIPNAVRWINGDHWNDDVQPYEAEERNGHTSVLPAWATDGSTEKAEHPASADTIARIKAMQEKMA